MINKSTIIANTGDITVNVINIENIEQLTVVVTIFFIFIFALFIVGIFCVVKLKASVNYLPKILNILQTIFSKVKPFLVKSSLQVLNLDKIKRTLLLAGLCVLFIILIIL